MSKVICDYSDISAIADAVRNKNGTTDKITLSGIVASINAIESKGGIQDISGTFNIALVEEMYEPGANLYRITFDNSIQLKDVVNLTLHFEYNATTMGQEDKDYEFWFARMKTDESLSKLSDNAYQSFVLGNFIINENSNEMDFIGTVNSNVEIDYIKYNLSNTRYEAVSI